MGLAKLDIPVNVLTWEISLPDRLVVKQFGGNALSADLVPAALANNFAIDGVDANDSNSNTWAQNDLATLQPGQIGGVIVDPQGAVIAGAEVTVSNTQTGASLTTKSDEKRSLGDCRSAAWTSERNHSGSGLQEHANGSAIAGVAAGTHGNYARAWEILARPLRSLTRVVQSIRRQIEELPVQSRRFEHLYSISQNVTNLQRRVAGILTGCN